jgi:hypothetical protein
MPEKKFGQEYWDPIWKVTVEGFRVTVGIDGQFWTLKSSTYFTIPNSNITIRESIHRLPFMNSVKPRPKKHGWLSRFLSWLKNGAEKSTKFNANCPTWQVKPKVRTRVVEKISSNLSQRNELKRWKKSGTCWRWPCLHGNSSEPASVRRKRI